MSSLKSDFGELITRIKHGRESGHASFEPIYYLIFPPSQILEVKRQTHAWSMKLHNEGWKVKIFSIAETIANILEKDPRRPLWLRADRKAPQDWSKTNQSIANALTTNNALQQSFETFLASLESKSNSLVLVTDLEALHPYLRIGIIESQLQGKVHMPLVFLYPGIRTGKSRLKFLGFYPEDGNYRSVHVGG